MGDTNYAVSGLACNDSGVAAASQLHIYAPSVSGVGVTTSNIAPTLIDYGYVHVKIAG